MFTFKAYSSKGKFFAGQIRSLTIKAIDGYVTILQSHSPLTSVARISTFYFIDKHDKKQECFVRRGILYVSNNETYLIADEIYYLRDLNNLIFERIRSKLETEIDNYNDKHYSAILRTSLKEAQIMSKKKYN